MIKLSLVEMAKKLNFAQPSLDATFEGISTDTRTIKPGNLYVAIRGERFDGHDFIPEAIKKGAGALLVDHPVAFSTPYLVVDDTVQALGKIGSFWRHQFSLPIIGITGSNGKTTLKNMLAAILRAACQDDHRQVLATEGNLNNHIGLPLMLTRLTPNHRYAVLEMGMNHFGEIAYLTQLTKPSITVITNAAEAHLEGVGDIAGVARAKGEIFQGLPPHGTAVLNRDDAHFEYWKSLLSDHRKLTFGLDNQANVMAKLYDDHIQIQTPQGQLDVVLSLLGKHNILNALAATACALVLEIDLKSIQKGLESVKAAPGRMHQYVLANGLRIIDDTYNANPFSTRAAIDTLKSFSGTKILVLGDMKELGEKVEEYHSLTGQLARESGIDYLFTFGQLTAATTEAFGKNAQHFTDREQLLTALQAHLKHGVTVLIKGSRSMKMEYFIGKLVPKDQLENIH